MKGIKDLKNSYVYPGLLSKEGAKYLLSFPDFPEISPVHSDSLNELVERAQQSLALHIIDIKERKLEPPAPSEVHGSEVIYVHIVLPYFISITKTVYIKKTVTIPEYLNILAEEKKINFSKAMVDGIKKELIDLGVDLNLIEP